MSNDVEKLEWFGGNQDALNMYKAFVSLSHIWDDLIDKDKPVSADEINRAFLTCLVYLPANPFYRSIQEQILPMWLVVVSAYETANSFEKNKDPHGIEIAHGLRYAVGNILAYVVHVCVGPEKAKEVLPDMWKTIFYERFDDYRKEHLDVDSK
jgi:purine-cytosine permease-like protein